MQIARIVGIIVALLALPLAPSGSGASPAAVERVFVAVSQTAAKASVGWLLSEDQCEEANGGECLAFSCGPSALVFAAAARIPAADRLPPCPTVHETSAGISRTPDLPPPRPCR